MHLCNKRHVLNEIKAAVQSEYSMVFHLAEGGHHFGKCALISTVTYGKFMRSTVSNSARQVNGAIA